MTENRDEYIAQLEKRIEKLEALVMHMFVDDCKTLHVENCQVQNLTIGDNCTNTFNNCPVGSITSDLEDAEDSIDDLEGRLEEIEDQIEDLNDELDELEERFEEMGEKDEEEDDE